MVLNKGIDYFMHIMHTIMNTKSPKRIFKNKM